MRKLFLFSLLFLIPQCLNSRCTGWIRSAFEFQERETFEFPPIESEWKVWIVERKNPQLHDERRGEWLNFDAGTWLLAFYIKGLAEGRRNGYGSLNFDEVARQVTTVTEYCMKLKSIRTSRRRATKSRSSSPIARNSLPLSFSLVRNCDI